jgi:hypothetical protein
MAWLLCEYELAEGRTYQTLDRVIMAMAAFAFPRDEVKRAQWRMVVALGVFQMKWAEGDVPVVLESLIETQKAIASVRYLALNPDKEIESVQGASVMMSMLIHFIRLTDQNIARLIDDAESTANPGYFC